MIYPVLCICTQYEAGQRLFNFVLLVSSQTAVQYSCDAIFFTDMRCAYSKFPSSTTSVPPHLFFYPPPPTGNKCFSRRVFFLLLFLFLCTNTTWLRNSEDPLLPSSLMCVPFHRCCFASSPSSLFPPLPQRRGKANATTISTCVSRPSWCQSRTEEKEETRGRWRRRKKKKKSCLESLG